MPSNANNDIPQPVKVLEWVTERGHSEIVLEVMSRKTKDTDRFSLEQWDKRWEAIKTASVGGQ